MLTGVQGATKAKYRRLVEQNMAPWSKSRFVRDGEGGITREMVQQWVNDPSAGAPARTAAARPAPPQWPSRSRSKAG
ncbi:hypothetical protein Srubr_64620 [Streptomyces rubradiris]|uniref:Transposase n=1 Tax=Streptomyces rubradiris TaxID=285531 RepID=A0ABQ3RL95_STRRR|nr:hypothetical protein GCM10018792_34180 [Streptomyces rubradiris]GHI56616.1 hypothetical protein Srubr_64620 [Streptomyces rubradiris]